MITVGDILEFLVLDRNPYLKGCHPFTKRFCEEEINNIKSSENISITFRNLKYRIQGILEAIMLNNNSNLSKDYSFYKLLLDGIEIFFREGYYESNNYRTKYENANRKSCFCERIN